MTEEINFLRLRNRLQEIKALYSVEHYKYLHIKTIENFLSQADSFSIKAHKEEIHRIINEYFDQICSSKIDNTTKSLEVFNTHIKPLIPLFVDLKGFHLAARFWVILIWIILIFSILFSFNVSLYFFAGFIILSILFITRQWYFVSQKRTYGFMH